MRDPSCKEKRRRSGSKIKWILRNGIHMHEVTDVIHRHDNHYQAAGEVDGGDTFHQKKILVNNFLLKLVICYCLRKCKMTNGAMCKRMVPAVHAGV